MSINRTIPKQHRNFTVLVQSQLFNREAGGVAENKEIKQHIYGE
jgi:hypothetical protein